MGGNMRHAYHQRKKKERRKKRERMRELKQTMLAEDDNWKKIPVTFTQDKSVWVKTNESRNTVKNLLEDEVGSKSWADSATDSALYSSVIDALENTPWIQEHKRSLPNVDLN
ncbi:hypothetical protein M199_gp280 [Halogranum tailed virus 1]|uniref:Uncharacterized protein n=1 Tax=Halogranum tailed virus 1 TaxID=1273749 RepID=R4TGN0_9CAUD|nr:hypothetical protein M199_gp280 [Halogranum tailed virus 1]AGM11386.1 hypothetical protein HGTV1_60 [Halogranum tailed virus 1]